MSELIEDPADEDIAELARKLVVARRLVREVTGADLTDGTSDLSLLQAVIDSAALQIDQTYELQCLGLALGRVFVSAIPGLDWAMFEDEYGRDPALRFEKSSILVFPLTMISKRIQDGENVDIVALFDGVSEHVSRLKVELG
jgi:hypothetical protein